MKFFFLQAGSFRGAVLDQYFFRMCARVYIWEANICRVIRDNLSPSKERCTDVSPVLNLNVWFSYIRPLIYFVFFYSRRIASIVVSDLHREIKCVIFIQTLYLAIALITAPVNRVNVRFILFFPVHWMIISYACPPINTSVRFPRVAPRAMTRLKGNDFFLKESSLFLSRRSLAIKSPWELV